MTTYCNIIRTNRTMGHKKVKDKCDDFKFEGGLYFVRREKIFLDKKRKLIGKIKPTLLYLEGVSDPLYIDNLSIKEYYDEIPILDNNNNVLLDPVTKRPLTKKQKSHKLEDIFIDSRAIHNLTDKKILDVLSATPEIGKIETITFLLLGLIIILGLINLFT